MSIKGTSQEKALKIAIILKKNGVDLSTLQLTRKVNGRIKYMLLGELEQEGVDIQKIIGENKLDGKFEIGAKIMAIRKAYNGVGVYEMTEKERKEVEEVGIIPKALIGRDKKSAEETALTPESLTEKNRQKQELIRKTEKAREIFERYNRLLGNNENYK